MNEIMTMRTELANQFAAAGAKLLDFTMTAGALAAIPNTTPQQYAVAGTLESIQKVLPAAAPSHPQRRMRHGDRPTEKLSFEDEADAQPVEAAGGAVQDDGEPLASIDHIMSVSIRDFSDFREDVERLSDVGLSRKQARIVRKAIYDTIDARVRNAVRSALRTATHPAEPVASADVAKLEQIAQSWDGCMADAPGGAMDVGATLRSQFKDVGGVASADAVGGALVASDGLLPCPFCGSTNIDPAEWSGNAGDSGPGCSDCGALADSAELWNRRAAPATGALVADVALSDAEIREIACKFDVSMDAAKRWKFRDVVPFARALFDAAPATGALVAKACPNGCTSPEEGGSGCMAVTGDCAMTESAAAPAGLGAIADYIADNWPMKKYTLEEIETRLRALTAHPPTTQVEGK